MTTGAARRKHLDELEADRRDLEWLGADARRLSWVHDYMRDPYGAPTPLRHAIEFVRKNEDHWINVALARRRARDDAP